MAEHQGFTGQDTSTVSQLDTEHRVVAFEAKQSNQILIQWLVLFKAPQ